MEDRELFQTIASLQTRAVLATVVSTKGSTPRKAGAKMLIGEEGAIQGTIGGGCGEGQVIETADDLFKGAGPQMVKIDLTDEITSWSPAVCGGIMNVLIELIDPEGKPR